MSIENGTQSYGGANRRKHRRIEAKYPICIKLVSPGGMSVGRYAETRNVSAAGVLATTVESVPAGTRVDMQIGIPSVYVSSLPGAQLNGSAVVVRSEPGDVKKERIFGNRVALQFIEKPKITTKITMFD